MWSVLTLIITTINFSVQNGEIDERGSVHEELLLHKFLTFLDGAPVKTVCMLIENFRYAQALKQRSRKKLAHINTIDDLVELLEKAKNVVVLTGAGVSVSCGIPDFRSAGGVYLNVKH